jgi:serine/threonine-protein kinase
VALTRSRRYRLSGRGTVTLPTTIGELRGIAGIGPGDVIAGKYRIEAVLGAGGMGVVFLARHALLGGPVALKFLSRDFVGNPQAVSRFHREAQAAARLKSEHVVRVFDVGVHESGSPYIVMEQLDGGDLQRLLRNEGRLSVEHAVDLALQACSALAEAHRAGIVHRDLKPSNLFCVPRADGRFTLKIVDFGISKLASADESVTVTGNFIGSPAYMSPEQMDAPNRVDERADLWSLGVVLYECVTGKLPSSAAATRKSVSASCRRRP